MSRQEAPRPKVAVIAGGGTLTALASDPFEICDYGQAGSLTAADLIDRCAAMADRVALVPLAFEPRPSFDMGPDQWGAICGLCAAALAEDPGLAGFVLTHGTGSLEEAAFFLSLVWDLPVPLVVTGAQRPASALSSDGYMNLFQAALVAAHPQARAEGVLVVAHGEIHLPFEVTKTATFGLDTFRSPDLGPVGLVIGGQVRFLRPAAPARRGRTGASSARCRGSISSIATAAATPAPSRPSLPRGRGASWWRASRPAMPRARRPGGSRHGCARRAGWSSWPRAATGPWWPTAATTATASCPRAAPRR